MTDGVGGLGRGVPEVRSSCWELRGEGGHIAVTTAGAALKASAQMRAAERVLGLVVVWVV